MANITKQTPKNSTTIFSKLIIVFSIAFITLLVIQFINEGHTKFIRYPEFGIDMPVNYSIHGIDVSHHNDIIDWQEVKQMNIRGISIQFAFIKATQGVNYVDDQFARNWKQSKKYGVTRGAYHYFNEYKTGAEQAKHFIATVGELLPGDLPPVLDIEENKSISVAQLHKEALEWLRIVEAKYNTKPLVYTYVNFYKQWLGEAFTNYPFWAAHYNEKHQPRTERNWQLWQHNEKGQVNGISTKVDFNVFNGDYFTFKQLLVK